MTTPQFSMRKLCLISGFAVMAFLLGCSPACSDRERLPDLTGVRVNVKETGTEKKVDELKGEDVIVAVDGVAYTKKMFDEERMLLVQQLRRAGRNPQEIMAKLTETSPLLVNHFVNRYLLILDTHEY